MNQDRLLGMMALGDAFGSLAAIGSGRPHQSRVMPLLLQRQAAQEQSEQARNALSAMGVPGGMAPPQVDPLEREASERLGFPIPDAAAPQAGTSLPPSIAATAQALAANDPRQALQFVSDYRLKAATQGAGSPFENFKVVGDDLITIGPDGQPEVAYEGGRNTGHKPNSAIAKLTADYRAGLIDEKTFTRARDKALRDPNGITIGPDGTVQIGGVASTSSTKTEAIKGRNAYDSLMSGLDDYAKLMEGGTALLPGERRDQMLVARRSLQLQMKELFNLGVLNGPDLTLMDQLLIDATDPANALLDATGFADFRRRAETNVSQLRKMMTDLVQPKLDSAGLPRSSGSSPEGGPAIPKGVEPDVWDAMTPQERALFQ